MDAYALVTMKYIDVHGNKATAPAGTVFADFDEDEFDRWKANAYVRKATVGEVAEAKAAGTYRGIEDGEGKAKRKSAAGGKSTARKTKDAGSDDGDGKKAADSKKADDGKKGDGKDEDLA